jgi:hypothetical protein
LPNFEAKKAKIHPFLFLAFPKAFAIKSFSIVYPKTYLCPTKIKPGCSRKFPARVASG